MLMSFSFIHLLKIHYFFENKIFSSHFYFTSNSKVFKYFKLQKNFFQVSNMSTTSTNEKKMLPLLEGKEIEFPCSWGKIKGKQFGSLDGIPVLALHGWLDNCHSFVPLMPYIVKENNLNVICLDEPGCGYSSHKPIGSDYKRWSFLSDLKRIINILNWKDITLLGHSQGGHYALLFASIFPTLIKRIILIDILKPISTIQEDWREIMAYIIDKHVETEELFLKNKDLHLTAPRHSEEEALKKVMHSHGYSLTQTSAKLLLQRGSKWIDDKLVFTRDIRLKLPPIDPLPNLENVFHLTEGIRCDLLIILAEQSVYKTSDSTKEKFFNMYEKNCRIFQSSLLPGTHHLHMNDPDIVSEVINNFIKDSLKLDEP